MSTNIQAKSSSGLGYPVLFHLFGGNCADPYSNCFARRGRQHGVLYFRPRGLVFGLSCKFFQKVFWLVFGEDFCCRFLRRKVVIGYIARNFITGDKRKFVLGPFDGCSSQIITDCCVRYMRISNSPQIVFDVASVLPMDIVFLMGGATRRSRLIFSLFYSC